MVANKVRGYMQQVLVGKPWFLQIIRNLVEIYGTKRFITGFTKACQVSSQKPARFPITSQINPFHALPHFFFKIHCNISLPSTTRSSKWSLSFRFSYQKPLLPHTCHMLGPSHSPSYGSTKHIWWGIQITKPLVTQFSSLPPQTDAKWGTIKLKRS